MRGLNGKHVLVTGGASGIGKATATRLVQEGAAVCVVDRSAEALARVAEQMPGLTAVINADVSNLEQVRWTSISRASSTWPRRRPATWSERAPA